MNPLMVSTLTEAVPGLLRCCRDPWAIIGSAAASLAGAAVSVADVDVLTSAADASRLAGHWYARREQTYEPVGAERFRSHFGRYRFDGLPLEVMGNLELFDGSAWQPVLTRACVRVACGAVQVLIPTVPEQIRILESFARPKDFERAARLRALSDA
ncbi:hypothetical protein [Dyella sp.]|uniref:hypothetical protein n=1 Tax=Dyella sp. TaxID=1869338 RepID=UPI002ED46780